MNGTVSKISDEDKKWHTEDDARTLMRAEEIKGDKIRLKSALVLLKEQSEQRERVLKSQ